MLNSNLMLRARFLGSALLTLLSLGCSHGVLTELPAAPTATVSLRQLTVTPVGGGSMIAGTSLDLVTSGNTLGVGAFAQYTDGTGKYVEATWTSSDPGILAFDGATMKAISRGTVTVTARFAGLSDTETFAVEPTMAGAWSGNLVVDECTAGSGSMTEVICLADRGGILPVGSTAAVTLDSQKSGTDLTSSTSLGNTRGTLRGADAGGNYFWLLGDLAVGNTSIRVVQWNAHVSVDTMEGLIVFEVRIAGLPSNALVRAHLGQMARR